jgi:drug/metabolite transporter (DMT)-like permease
VADAPRLRLWLAYAAVVVIGGANFVAVSISNEGLAPFWGAGVRFAFAAALMIAVASLARIALPRGRALFGAVLYGVTAFAIAYALAYWALLEVPAGMLSIVLATTPLLTAFLAPLHRLERLHARTVAGGALAFLGVAVVLREQATLDVPGPYLIAAVLFAVAVAESAVLIKWFPRAHPLATNGVAMAVGGVLLLSFSYAVGEAWSVPHTWRVASAVFYLAVVGSIGLFGLFLYTLARLPVTTTSYQTALMPLVTVVLASWLLDQAVTVSLLVGAALVFAGLYLGIGRAAAGAPAGSGPTAATAASAAMPAAGATRATLDAPAAPPAPSAAQREPRVTPPGHATPPEEDNPTEHAPSPERVTR